MSLGGGEYTAQDGDSPIYLGVINNLVDAGIAVVIATGTDEFFRCGRSRLSLSCGRRGQRQQKQMASRHFRISAMAWLTFMRPGQAFGLLFWVIAMLLTLAPPWRHRMWRAPGR